MYKKTKISTSIFAMTFGFGALLPLQAAGQDEGFQVGNTNFTIGGYIKLDTIATRTSDGKLAADSLRDFYVPSTTPVGGGDSNESLTMHARQSRFSINTVTDLGTGTDLTGFVEMDFGPARELLNGTSTTNRAAVNLRHAYFEYGNWGFGQTWSNALFGPAMLETLNFFSVSEGVPTPRQPQIRYENGPWAVSLENPTTTAQVEGANTSVISSNVEVTDSILPDVVVRYSMMGQDSQLALVGIVRQLKVDGTINNEPFTQSTPTLDETESGYGLGVSGNVQLSEATDFKFMALGGSGVGRYSGLAFAPDVVVASDGSGMEAVDHVGFNLGIAHRINKHWRTNVGFGMEDADVEGQKMSETSWSGTANIMYSPAPALTFGAEVKHGERTLVDDTDGSQSRLQFSAKYSF
ncbi:DcaP family trimeric outer membrane transporter [Vreelandella utahensis]|uniref:DcaP family trimeric outer membrane transporter n=1 Tax=Vreelandella halophila TaxID=86177 RepID=UPI000985B5D8|nr:DcaP family trimeric outer membrane transporter [Halomonas utahensis]